MDGYIYEFARQGLGYLIAVLLSGVIVWMQRRIDGKDKQITELQDKLLLATNTFTNTYTATIKEVVAATKDTTNGLGLLQRSVDGLVSVMQNMVNKK